MLFGLSLGTLVAWGGLLVAGVDVGWTIQRLRYRLVPPPPMGIYRNDPQVGVVHVPGTVVRVKTSEYDVLYSIDENGARRVPGARAGRPLAVFLGDSFTFGHGVEDDEAYPARVQARWPAAQVRNRGLNGGSTANALLALRRDLARGDVRLAVYGWLVIQNWRNYLDRSWLEMVTRSHQKLPLFRVENGRPTGLRLVDASEARSRDEPGFVEEEWNVTLALIREMAIESRQHGARFVFVVLPIQTGADVQRAAIARLQPFLRDEGIETVDLQDDPAFAGPGLFFKVDGHPTPEWHRRVGAALARAIAPPTP